MTSTNYNFEPLQLKEVEEAISQVKIWKAPEVNGITVKVISATRAIGMHWGDECCVKFRKNTR